MKKSNNKIKNNILKISMALMLIGVIVLASLPTKIEAEGSYDTKFSWTNAEEDLNEWPLEEGLTKTRAGIGTAGFSYNRFYRDDQGRIVLEIDFSIFPDDITGNDFSSRYTTFREQWEFANIFIDPDLASKVDDAASFFMMSYPANIASVALSNADKSGNIYKLNVNEVYPKMPAGSDYMKSKLYLVLQSGVTRNQLNQDYALELRYTNSRGQVYEQRGSKDNQVLANYLGYTPSGLPNYDASANNDDVTLKTIAPFQTASMPNTIPNPVLPPDMMRAVGQSVIYDNIQGKLHVYYKQAPNHYLYRTYANNGLFLSSKIGIRQVMDSRIFEALKPDDNGVIGQMQMFDLDGKGSGWNVSTDIKPGEFSYRQVTGDVGTYSYMMVPDGFKTEITSKATVPPNHTNNVKNVYLHGHKKEADYVRFIYNVDKNKMDALFEQANSSTFSISTSYITDRPTETTQTEYRLEAGQNIVIPKGATVVFDLPKSSRSVFKAGLANNYERIIGDMTTKRPASEMNISGVDPTDFGKAYTITPYVATSGGFLLTIEAGLTVSSEDISLIMFDSQSPATVTMTVISGDNATPYTLSKYKTDENRLYTMPNADVRSGIIINRSANTPHINEFFTDSTTITGHSKYADALVSVRLAKTNPNEEEVFEEAYSSTSPEPFTAEGLPHFIVEETQQDYSGYAFTLDIPPEIQFKKDMALRFSNAAPGYFRSLPATYRVQAKVTFDHNSGSGEAIERIVPINKKAYGEEGYEANGFEDGPGKYNILWLDAQGEDAPADATEKYLSDYEGLPITDTASTAYTSRQFYSEPTAREGYTFLGWSTKQVNPMSSTDFAGMPEITDVADWDDNTANYKFTATSPVDQNRTVYAVWEKNLDTLRIVLHDNNDEVDVTHTVELPLVNITNGNTGELTAYLKEAGNTLYDKGFVKNGSYFVGWSEIETVTDQTKVHELYTNGSKVQLVTEGLQLKLQLQLNEEPVEPVSHINPWETVGTEIVNNNGIATIDLYAQYKPLVSMTATKHWYAKGQKEIYEQDPSGYTGAPLIPAPFSNSDVAMVLMRTTEGKTLDPTKYEIVEGFYVQGNNTPSPPDSPPWQWAPQEGHDANGRKYSYLMTEFNANNSEHTEEAIINHFNTHRTWASMYITMIGQSDQLSKYTAISFVEGNDTKSYMAVATSNQPDAVSQQFVNRTVNYAFELKNFQVDVLPAIIHRIQTNHSQIVIDRPTDGADYLYFRLSETSGYVLFEKNAGGRWILHHSNSNAPLTISDVEAEGKLIISSSTGEPLNFEGRAGEQVFALFTIQNVDQDLSKYASREIQAYGPLPALEDVKQEPHIKDASGQITHNVISAKIPAGSYAGADYTLGYMDEGDNFVPVTVGENNDPITVKPDGTGKLTFNVPDGKLNGTTEYIIRGIDPADTFKLTDFAGPDVDLTAPTITAEGFTLLTGDLISDTDGQVTTDDLNASLSYSVKKDNAAANLPEGLTFDPTTGKFSGKTADTLPAEQLGDYTITISAEDIYGNIATKDITLTISQKPTTDPITSITQNANDDQGNASLTVQGQQGATIKLYSENEGTFTEIDIPGVSGSQIANDDGTIGITISQADVRRFNGRKVYVTQKMANELESDKADLTAEDVDRAGNKKIATGGAIVIDNIPPTPLQMVQPKEWSNNLKITNVSADENTSDVRDIDRIDLQIGNNLQCTILRQYDDSGTPTGKWRCNTREFEEGTEEVTVIVNPNTGETATKTVGVLNYILPEGSYFVAYQSITAIYYDYLGNASFPVSTTVLKLPEPIAPYDMTAINNSQDHPTTTVISGKADPGAQVSVEIENITYSVTADELGEFTIEIPKQPKDTEITVTAKLNNYTATGTVIVENVQADDYEPQVTDITKSYGEATTETDIKDAVTVPNYPKNAAEQPTITIDEGAELPDGNTLGEYSIPVTVTYPDGTKDKASVTVNVIDDEKPIITTKNATVIEGTQIDPISVTATDNVGVKEITVELPLSVAGLSYNNETKQIEGIPTKLTDWNDTDAPNYEETRDFTVIITAKDTSDNIATKSITITLQRDTDSDGIPDIFDPDDDDDGIFDDEDAQPKLPNAKGKNLTTEKDTLPGAIRGIKNASKLPSGTTFQWKAEPDVTLAGETEGTILVTYPASEGAEARTEEITVTVTVTDTKAPIIDTIDDQVLVEGKAIEDVIVKTDEANVTVTVEGLPSVVTFDPATGKISGTPVVDNWGSDEEKEFTVTVTAADASNNKSTETFTITVLRDTDGDGVPDITDPDDDGDGYSDVLEKEKGSDPKDANSVPSFLIVPIGKVTITPEKQNVVEGNAITTVKIEVPDTSTVTVDVPAGSDLTYDDTTKEISGTPTVTDWGATEEVRVIEIPVKGVDAQGATVRKTVEITVYRDTDRDGKVDLDTGIVDPDTGDVLVEGDLDDDGDGYSDVREKAAGSNPKNPNSIPAIVIPPVGGVTITPEKQNVVERNAITTVEIKVPDTSTVTVDVPAGSDLTYDDAKKEISGTPTVADWGATEELKVIEIPVTVVDAQGATVKNTVTITLQRDTDEDGIPDIFDPDDDDDGISDDEDAQPKLPNAKGKDLTTEQGTLPEAVRGIKNASKLPSGTTFQWKVEPNVNELGETQGTILVTYPASEGAEARTEEITVTVTVTDTKAPIIDTIDDQVLVEGKAIEDIIVKTDEENVTITVDGLPSEVTFNPATGKISGTPVVDNWGSDEEKEFTVTVTAEDASNNKSTETFTITVLRDTDADGIPDITDPDDDNDGILDEEDAKPKVWDAQVSGAVETPFGVQPELQDYVNNIANLPEGSKAKLTALPNVNEAGNTEATVEVELPNGEKAQIVIPVVVGAKQAETIDPTVPGKTEVKDKNNLADEEKTEVKKKIEKANEGNFPAGTTVTVGANGDTTITYPDGSKDTIPGNELVVEKAVATPTPTPPAETTNPEATEPTKPESTDPTQTTDPDAIDKVIPVGADIDSPIPENYIRVYFDPQGDGWLAYNPTFATGKVIAFDVLKDITWGDALANGLEVPTATNVDPSYTFDKWSLVLEEDTLVNNTTYRYYYFVASYKLADKDSTTPAGTKPTSPAKDGTTDPLVKTGESTPPILIAIGFILAGGLLLVIMSKTKKDKEQSKDQDKEQDKRRDKE